MQKYGLIGYPLKHSFSIGYFNEKFKAENIDAEYVNFEIPRIEDFMEVIEENPNLCGLNVTIPYKEQVIPYLDELEDYPPFQRQSQTGWLQLRHHRIYTIHRTTFATTTQESPDFGYRRCIESRISRAGEPGYKKFLRITRQERG